MDNAPEAVNHWQPEFGDDAAQPGPLAASAPGGALAQNAQVVDTLAPAPTNEVQPEPSQSVATASLEADCLCWPHCHASLGPPPPLDEILAEVWKDVVEVIHGVNDTVDFLRTRASDPTRETPISAVVSLMAKGPPIRSALNYAIDLLSQTPGYIFPKVHCKNTFERHLEHLARRDDRLRGVEEKITKAMEEARPTYEARHKILDAERTMRRLKAMHTAARATAILTLPFAPVVSAALTGIGTLVLAVRIGIEELVVPEAELHSTAEGVESIWKDLEEKVAVAQRLRRELVAIRAKVEAQRDDPVASRLFSILQKLQAVKDLAEAVTKPTVPLEAKEPKSTPAPSVRELVSVTRELLDLLGEPPAGVEPLVELDESTWTRLHETLVMLKGVVRV